MNQEHIESLLPVVLRRALAPGEPMAATLAVMEALHAPTEAALTGARDCLDPRRAPDEWVPLLARWVGIDYAVTTGLGRLRELVTVAVALSQKRGTADGLRQLLETATGQKGFAIDDRVTGQSGRARPFHIRVTAPAAARAHDDMLRQIIIREKPAYVTYELAYAESSQGDTNP